MGGHKDVVVVDVEFAGVGNSLPQLAGVGLAEGHYVPRPLRVLDLKHQRGRVHLIWWEAREVRYSESEA